MIPGQFEYHRPASVADAVGLLASLGEEARVVAGGHSLIPMMKLRMAQPDHLIDLQDLSELKYIREDGDDLVIGAMTTQAEIITSDLLAQKCPILAEAALQIADPQIRNLGTLGGNVANGDPGNDMPAIMQMLDARYDLAGPNGTRQVGAREFYEGAYFTALEDGEILTAVRFATPAAGHGWCYAKQKRKIGDYATAAAAVILTLSGGKCTDRFGRADQCGRHAAPCRGGGGRACRLHAGRGRGRQGRGGSHGNHRSGERRARAGRIQNKGCGRHGAPGRRGRARTRRRLTREEKEHG